MTLNFYERKQALATRLLSSEKLGQSKTGHVINILYKTVGAAGATDLDEDTITWPATQVPAASRGVNERRDGATLFAAAERVFVIAAASVTQPEIDDKIEEAGVEYSIVSVEPSSNDGTVAAYKVYVKR